MRVLIILLLLILPCYADLSDLTIQESNIKDIKSFEKFYKNLIIEIPKISDSEWKIEDVENIKFLEYCPNEWEGVWINYSYLEPLLPKGKEIPAS